MSRVTAICSQKGGVGKTSTAVNLAAFLSHAGYRTLVLDLDPQANATSGLGCEVPQFAPLRLLLSNPRCWDEITVETAETNLYLVPSKPDREVHLDLEQLDQGVVARIREELLRVKPAYDFVLIDAPPTLGPLALLALQLADTVLIPVQCEFFAMEGLSQMMPLLELVEGSRGRPLPVEGLLLTMFDEELQLSYDVQEELERCFPDLTLKTVIPRDVAIAEAASHGVPICEYDLRARGAWAYLKLAKEIIEHVRESEEARTGSGLPDPSERRLRTRS